MPFETPKSAFHFQRPAQPGALGLDREGCPDPPTASTEAPRGRDATNSAAISSSNGGTEAICECGGWLVWDWLVRMVPVALPGV